MSKWGVGNLLYILTRYTAFVESPFLILCVQSYYSVVYFHPLTGNIVDAFNVGYGHSSNAKMVRLLPCSLKSSLLDLY